MTPNSKRGLMWPWNNPSTFFGLYTPHISSRQLTWLSNWEMWQPENTPTDLEYIPLVRTGAQASEIDACLTTLQTSQGRIEALLGFNEPERSDQAGLSVDDAVELWKRFVIPARQKFGCRLGSPGISSAPEGKSWLNDFVTKLSGDGDCCDFVVVHWYGPKFGDMKRHLEDVYRTFGRPLWVNEFACSNMDSARPVSIETVEAFMREALPWLDQCEFVERYAYFGAIPDVGEWVGTASGFTEVSAEEGEQVVDGRRLSKVGRTYCEL